MYPHTITIINRFNNRGKVEYYFTQVENVHWQDKQGIKTGSDIHYTDNNGYIQIPYTKGHELVKRSYKSTKPFIEPNAWIKLEDKHSAWTLQVDDFAVKGIVYPQVVKDIPNLRVIDSIENIDYSAYINSHYGVTLK